MHQLALQGTITTTNDAVTFGTGGVTLGAASAVATAGGLVTFEGLLNGGHNLTVTAAAGNVTFSGAVGGSTRLGTLNIVTAGDVTAGALTLAAFDQDAGTGTTTLGGAVDTNAAGGVVVANTNLAVNAAVTTTGNGVVTFTQSGTTTIAAAGNIISDGAVTITSVGGTTTSADVTTTRDVIEFASNTAVNADLTLNTTSGGAAGAAITFGGNITNGGANDLILVAGTGGAITVAGTTAVTDLTLTKRCLGGVHGERDRQMT